MARGPMSAQWVSNIDGIYEYVGAARGIMKGTKSPDYMASIIQNAHAEVSEKFDVAAAATAGAGRLTHVYEYGVPGITRGPMRISDPTSPQARLWVHTITGRGGHQSISFAFRPAVVPNPQPTKRDTGVSTKYLRKLSRRKYIFRNKAFVMETGQQVSIKPKNGNFIFVPFYGEESHDPMNKRGFMMRPFGNKSTPILATPGKSSQGSFAAFWNVWWNATGKQLINERVGTDVELAMRRVLQEATVRANATTIKPVALHSSASKVSRSAKIAAAALESQAKLKKRKRT
jgi:hypothetical protein